MLSTQMTKRSCFLLFFILSVMLLHGQDTETPDESPIPPPPPFLNLRSNDVQIMPNDFTPDLIDNTDFGIAAIGASVTKTYVISNSGGDYLTLLGTPSIRIVGSGAANFSVASQPGLTMFDTFDTEQTSFQITFTPNEAGVFEANVEIECNHLYISPMYTYTFSIQGTSSGTMSVVEAAPVDEQIKVYQHETSNMVTVHSESNIVIKNIEVFDVSGKLIFTKKLTNGIRNQTINLPLSLRTGLYFLKFQTSKGNAVKRLILN